MKHSRNIPNTNSENTRKAPNNSKATTTTTTTTNSKTTQKKPRSKSSGPSSSIIEEKNSDYIPMQYPKGAKKPGAAKQSRSARPQGKSLEKKSSKTKLTDEV